MSWLRVFVAGLFFVSVAAHADFEMKKDKGIVALRMHDGWSVGDYQPSSGVIGFFADVKNGKAGDISLILTKRDSYDESRPWPWRECIEVWLHLDSESLRLREAWPPSWDFNQYRRVVYSMSTDVETLEKTLLSKEATIKVCEDEIKITPSMRLDLMRFRDAYRKYL